MPIASLLTISQFEQYTRLHKVKEFFQRKGETVVVNGDTTVTVLGIRDGEVVLAVDGPEWAEVREGESLEAARRSATVLPQ